MIRPPYSGAATTSGSDLGAAGIRLRACRSPQTKASASTAALKESRFPMDRKLARLAAESSESLANAAVVQRRTSLTSPDRAAATVPRPKTRSRMPMVRMSSMSVPVGSGWPASRIGTPGAAVSAMPTAALSHPIVS